MRDTVNNVGVPLSTHNLHCSDIYGMPWICLTPLNDRPRLSPTMSDHRRLFLTWSQSIPIDPDCLILSHIALDRVRSFCFVHKLTQLVVDLTRSPPNRVKSPAIVDNRFRSIPTPNRFDRIVLVVVPNCTLSCAKFSDQSTIVMIVSSRLRLSPIIS